MPRGLTIEGYTRRAEGSIASGFFRMNTKRCPVRRYLDLTRTSLGPRFAVAFAQRRPEPAPVGAAQNVEGNHAIDQPGAEQAHEIAGARDRDAIDGEQDVAGE